MPTVSLDALAGEQIALAAQAGSGRSSTSVYGGGRLRQALLALVAGASLPDHENPGEATLLVIRGHVRLQAASEAWEARAGELLVIPDERHGLEALEDSAVLLTVLPRD